MANRGGGRNDNREDPRSSYPRRSYSLESSWNSACPSGIFIEACQGGNAGSPVKMKRLLWRAAGFFCCMLMASHGVAENTTRDETAMELPQRQQGPGEVKTLFDFSTGAGGWQSIDDPVMGGSSQSEMTVENSVAVFKGNVSLENDGGFASTRSAAADYDLSGYEGLLLRVRGDGKRYGIRLRTLRAFDGVSYQAEIQPPADEWGDIRVPFADFEPVFRGRFVSSALPLDPGQVKTFGLLIAWKQEGVFRFEVARIGAYGSPTKKGDVNGTGSADGG